MRKVLVVGSGGAGKSTFAKRLADQTGIEAIHLDALYWRPGWIETPKDDWNKIVDTLIQRERWIMDGNYGGSLLHRMTACDTVIFLDLPRVVCLLRVLRRRLRFHNRARPDMNPGCPERLSWWFLVWIWTYPTRRKPGILSSLGGLRPDQRAVILKSQIEIEAFLQVAG